MNGNNNPNEIHVNIDMAITTPVECENCHNDLFDIAFKLRRAPKLLIGAPQDVIVPVQVFVCGECGHVNQEFVPKIGKQEDKPNE